MQKVILNQDGFMIIRPKYLKITEGKMSVTLTFVLVTNLFWLNIQTSGRSSNSQTGGSGANLLIWGLNLLFGKTFCRKLHEN